MCCKVAGKTSIKLITTFTNYVFFTQLNRRVPPIAKLCSLHDNFHFDTPKLKVLSIKNENNLMLRKCHCNIRKVSISPFDPIALIPNVGYLIIVLIVQIR